MTTSTTVGIAVALLVAAIAYLRLWWGGICPACKSWKTAREVVPLDDAAHPGFIVEHSICVCKRCQSRSYARRRTIPDPVQAPDMPPEE